MNLKNNPELIPLIEWWEKDGKQTVAMLAVAAIAVGGWYGWKGHRDSVRAAASESLVSSYTAEELEEAVSRFSGQDVGGALKIRLAKSYFDAGRYEEALAQYDDLVANPPDGFADIPAVGRAQCLEAQGKFAEAAEAFDAFAEANPKSYLKLTAQLGAARAFAQAGDRAKALARIDALKAAAKGDDLATARVEATESAIKRYEAKK
jgi:tetratricopeptide (TPR) repeat protein